MNQQKFFLTQEGEAVKAKAGIGLRSKMDLGIVKYPYELAAGMDNFTWV